MYIIKTFSHKQGFHFKNWYFLSLILKPIKYAVEVHQKADVVLQARE